MPNQPTSTQTLTTTQAARKVAAARKRMIDARDLLTAVCNDYSARSYMLSRDEEVAWRESVRLCSALERLNLDDA